MTTPKFLKRPVNYCALCMLIWLLVFLFSGCSSNQTESINDSEAKAELISPKYAKGFSIDNYGTYQVLHILQPFNDEQDTLSYLLYKRGTEKPDGFKKLPAIATPIQKMIVQSTTHVALMAELNALDLISGMTAAQFVYNSSLRDRVANGDVVEVGEGEQLNQEQIMVMQPDVLMVSGFSASSFRKNYATLLDVGIPVLINSEWMEQDMLGRAEWLKVVGYLIGQPALAESKFQKIEAAYNDYAKIGRTAQNKPLVIGGLPYKGSWSIAGAKSYVAKLLTDAGASWNWANDSTSTSLQMDFESVYPIGLKAEYWLRVGGVKSKKELLAIDERFVDFKAYKNGNLYNNNKRLTADGLGNDYWESGIVNPHLILADIIKIIHPDMLPEHELMYYQRVEQ